MYHRDRIQHLRRKTVEARFKRVTISDCHISSGDDCIAISSITDLDKPCEDVVVANCVLRSCSKAIVIGYIYSVVRNVLITNCIVRESNSALCVMCHDECGLIENVRVMNCVFDTRIRAGNWWGNGEPILMMAVRHDMHLPAGQKPVRVMDCAIRNVHFDGITCMGENAMGIIGTAGNILDISLRNIDYIRKPSANLPLKGACFDLSPFDTTVEAPVDCGLLISGAEHVAVEHVNTREWTIIQ